MYIDFSLSIPVVLLKVFFLGVRGGVYILCRCLTTVRNVLSRVIFQAVASAEPTDEELDAGFCTLAAHRWSSNLIQCQKFFFYRCCGFVRPLDVSALRGRGRVCCIIP